MVHKFKKKKRCILANPKLVSQLFIMTERAKYYKLLAFIAICQAEMKQKREKQPTQTLCSIIVKFAPNSIIK